MRIVGFIIFLFTTLLINATNLRFNHYTVKNGLSNESSYIALQDSEGYLWIATNDGLDRFDGIYFKIYKSDINDSASICGNVISDIYIDNKNDLWVATDQGVCRYNKLLDNFSRPIAELASNYCKAMIQDKTGNYYFSTGQSLYIYNSALQLLYNVNQNNKLGDISIYSMDFDSEGILWLGTKMHGIYYYNPVKNEINHYETTETMAEIVSVFADSYGNIWFGSPQTPFVYKVKEKSMYNLMSANLNFNVPQKPIASVMQDKEGILWMANYNFGITKYNIRENDYEEYPHNENDPSSIGKGRMEYSLMDKEGNIWIGGNTCGINVIYKNNRKFNTILETGDLQILKNPISAMTQDNFKNFWLGVAGIGIMVWDQMNNSFTLYKNDPDNKNSYGGLSTLTLFNDSQGRIWGGGYNSGLNLFNPDTKKFTVFSFDKNPPYTISGTDIRDIIEDRNGNIWVATNGGGINIYNPVTFDREVITVEKNKISSNYCITLFCDKDNRIWIGTYDGLNIYNPMDNTVKIYRNDKTVRNSLPSNWVYCIYYDTHGKYWLGTQFGLARYNEDTDDFTVYLEEQGLPNNTIMAIEEDTKGNLWISTNEGISVFNSEKEIFKNYSIQDGLPDNQFRTGSVHKTADGTLFFGGNKGVVYFDPAEIKNNPVVPEVKFTNLEINKAVIVPSKSKILKKHINYIDQIKLKHNENFIRIDFIAISYFHAEKNSYEYMLEGVDKEWVFNGTNTSASYTNLQHGHFTFKVRAYNNDGVPSEIKSLKIRIKPAWYNTIFFYGLIFILVIYGIYNFVKLRDREAKRDKLVLEKKIAEGEKIVADKVKLLEKQQQEIIERDNREKEIRYQMEGIAQIADIISRKRKNLVELAKDYIIELVKYSKSNAGIIYIIDDADPQKIKLQMAGHYCIDIDSEKRNEFAPGEGYIGTCYIEKKTIQISDLPEGYIIYRSGLGEISLKYTLLVPVIDENICLGVIEIASLEELPAYVIKYIEKASDSFASILAIIKANNKTKEMLDQNNIQSEELKAQEEELRQNLEELQSTQDELKRREDNLTAQLNDKKIQEEKLIQKLSEIQNNFEELNRQKEVLLKELGRKNL